MQDVNFSQGTFRKIFVANGTYPIALIPGRSSAAIRALSAAAH